MTAAFEEPQVPSEAFTPRRSNLVYWHDRLVILVSCALCVTSQLKLFEIQYLELFFMVDAIFVFCWFVAHGRPIRLLRPLGKIGFRWFLFSSVTLLLALLALRQNFFVEQPTLFKRPFIVTIARVVELGVDVTYMLFLAERLRRFDSLRRLAAWSYFLVGMAGSIYALISLAIMLVASKPVLLGVDPSYRMVGFNNEGGSYGTYLLTVIFITLLLRTQRWLGPWMTGASLLILTVTLAGTRSKAALFEIALFGVVAPVLRMHGLKLVLTILTTIGLFSAIYIGFDVGSQIKPYLAAANSYQIVSKLRPDDLNVVVGRAAGVFFAPTMIATHPLVGIGLGNYPIIRDDPQYRRGTPIVAVTLDSPSLGPIDYIVELGIPLFLYFTWVELAPTLLFIRRGASFPLISLVFMQPVSNWFGAHLNITYPWITAGIALGFFYAASVTDRTSEVEGGTGAAA